MKAHLQKKNLGKRKHLINESPFAKEKPWKKKTSYK